MRQGAILIAALLVPVLAGAKAAPDPLTEWTRCAADAECVVVKGVCNPAAVHVGYEQAAETYFKQRAEKEKVKCMQKFWQPSAEKAIAHCRLERCEIVGK